MTGPLGSFAVVAVVVLFAGVADALRQKRVVGGTKAAPGEFPYIASLRHYGEHFCAGAIIGRRHILTAGHCVDLVEPHMVPDLSVGTGSVLLNAGTNHAIRSITIHPDYYHRHVDVLYDIAIVELDADIEFDENQAPIDLPTDVAPEGVDVKFAGWGHQYFRANAYAPELMKMTVKKLSIEECRRYYDGYTDMILSSNMCTIGNGTVGACRGDSGGPFVYNNQVIGLSSWCLRCAQGYPDVQPNVYYFNSWIKETLKSHDIRQVAKQAHFASPYPSLSFLGLLKYLR